MFFSILLVSIFVVSTMRILGQFTAPGAALQGALVFVNFPGCFFSPTWLRAGGRAGRFGGSFVRDVGELYWVVALVVAHLPNFLTHPGWFRMRLKVSIDGASESVCLVMWLWLFWLEFAKLA